MIYIEDLLNTQKKYKIHIHTIHNKLRMRELTVREYKELVNIDNKDFEQVFFLLKKVFEYKTESKNWLMFDDSIINVLTERELIKLFNIYNKQFDYKKLDNFLKDKNSFGDINFYFNMMKEFNYEIDLLNLTHSFMMFLQVAVQLKNEDQRNNNGKNKGRALRRK